MTTIYVEFTDSTESAIASVFSSQQDPKYYANQGTVDETDARYKAFYESLPAFAQEGFPVSQVG